MSRILYYWYISGTNLVGAALRLISVRAQYQHWHKTVQLVCNATEQGYQTYRFRLNLIHAEITFFMLV